MVRIAASLRLGIPLCGPQLCFQCGNHVNELTTHGLSCRFSTGRLPWHASIKTIVKIHGQYADPLHTGASRPLGIGWQTSRWGHDHPMSSRANLGLGCYMPRHLYAASHVALATTEAGAVATTAEVKKNAKYQELARTHHVARRGIEASRHRACLAKEPMSSSLSWAGN